VCRRGPRFVSPRTPAPSSRLQRGAAWARSSKLARAGLLAASFSQAWAVLNTPLVHRSPAPPARGARPCRLGNVHCGTARITKGESREISPQTPQSPSSPRRPQFRFHDGFDFKVHPRIGARSATTARRAAWREHDSPTGGEKTCSCGTAVFLSPPYAKPCEAIHRPPPLPPHPAPLPSPSPIPHRGMCPKERILEVYIIIRAVRDGRV